MLRYTPRPFRSTDTRMSHYRGRNRLDRCGLWSIPYFLLSRTELDYAQADV